MTFRRTKFHCPTRSNGPLPEHISHLRMNGFHCLVSHLLQELPVEVPPHADQRRRVAVPDVAEEGDVAAVQLRHGHRRVHPQGDGGGVCIREKSQISIFSFSRRVWPRFSRWRMSEEKRRERGRRHLIRFNFISLFDRTERPSSASLVLVQCVLSLSSLSSSGR